MPVSLEQWRASLGSNNNAPCSHMLAKCAGRKRAPRGVFVLFLVALFSRGGLVTNKVHVSCAMVVSSAMVVPVPITLCAHDLTRSHGSTPKGNWKERSQLLCLAFSVTVAACLLCQSGDVETNPGPGFDLVRANLPKLLNLLVDATPQWFELGLQLGIDQTTLKIIERDNRDMTRRCFIEMLSEWLKMIDPLPSWEGLIAVLKLPSVGHKCLAKTVETELGMAVVHEEASGKGLAASTAMGVVHGEASTTNMGVVHGEASGMRLPASITLVIEKEEYSITEQPPESSGLVIALKDDLYGELNLKEMIS